ncbi:hypothetical protein L208DRAFT_1255414 [Tricholoma matsutake]|nr:hypothetical protein L208DRAFT_1255414 [Tricholoma matsutake 945]
MLAKLSTHLLPPDNPKMNITPTLKVTGAKLAKVSQSLTYKAIQAKKLSKLKDRVPCSHTAVNLKLIKDKMKSSFEICPTDTSFWRAIQNQDFSQQSQYWLWMSTHDAYMMGSNWLHSNYNQEFQAWVFSKHNGQLETMEYPH